MDHVRDAAHETTIHTIVGVKAVLDAVRAKQLKARIVLCGILPRDGKFTRLLGGEVASVGRLERLLAQTLNDGHTIAWCAVRRGKTDFRYRLTPEKKARLQLEGK